MMTRAEDGIVARGAERARYTVKQRRQRQM